MNDPEVFVIVAAVTFLFGCIYIIARTSLYAEADVVSRMIADIEETKRRRKRVEDIANGILLAEQLKDKK